MSIERTYYCDGPDCGGEDNNAVHAQTATPPPHLPGGFLVLRGDRWMDGKDETHFCSWDCVMKYAATHPADSEVEA